MSFNCKYCGRELPDDAAFCEGCGATFDTDKIICLSCGERLDPGTTLCPACGARIYNTVSDGPAEMEELVPPVITDDMFTTRGPEDYAIESADESVYANRPAAPVPPPVQTVPPAEAPRPAQTRPAESIPVPIRAKPHAPAQVAPLLNHPRPAAPSASPQTGAVIDDQEPYVSNSSSQFKEAARPAQPRSEHAQPGAYQQDPFQQVPHNPYPDPARMRVEGGKKGRSLLIPIILIILIIAVVLVDVFVIFRDRIFGSDDSKASKSAAVITVTDFFPEE
ncbi:Double zinc ribbon [Ruminococcaceae bacterium FB2012]|nr:Double zinc ribbon [Ruminococcaceae bacterium FB2012]